QLLFVGALGTIIGIIRSTLGTAVAVGISGGASLALLTSLISGSASIFAIVSVIAGFFIVVGIQYLLARAFNGQGSFLQQAYDYTLFYVPISVVSTLIGFILGFIPVLGLVMRVLVGFALAIYQIVLNVFSIMASHRLTGGKATAVVLIPLAVIILLFFLCAFIAIAVFVTAMHGAGTSP
ncbi:MAG TPA: Yip1 family protein, partial [Ktedonobacteraceae bacterium]|nr:Yip1 family protein [Ktedonobacteraceae bacterium]